MNITSGQILEFESLRELLGRYVGSPLGRAELEKITPVTDRSQLETIHAENKEAIEYLRSAMQPQPAQRGSAIRIRFRSIPDAAEAVAKLRIEGATLEARQIFDLSALLDQAGEARSLISAVEERFPLLSARASQIDDFRPLIRDLSGKILPDGSVADDASVALHRLRRDIERQQKAIQSSLERFIKQHREEGTLQEEFVTIRNERFVVPVVSGQRRKIDGVIHAASASGHTLFVEPMETIDLNNELVRLREEEAAEVHRILRELTDRLRQHAESIAYAVGVMGELEILFAKAQFAIDFDCVTPSFSTELTRRLWLKDARHPLLQDVLRRQRKAVVPITLQLDEDCRTALISGPNTGGKTVSMKTVGLLSLMAHSGIPVPAAEAVFPIFDCVLADIGDNQSIQESLSTFSAHIETIKSMLCAVTPDSLILLDELGRATDPEEGGALGVSILDTFRSTGSFTLASTHLLAIKIYGANTKGVLNASMGFDEGTLEPTYILRTGAPGKSAGLQIARRLGLEAQIIDKAKSVMSSSERDLAQFLSDLHGRLERVTQLENELRAEREKLATREAQLTREYGRKLEDKTREMERRTNELADRFEQHARETIDQITQTLEQRKAAEKAMRRVAQTRREFVEQSEQAAGELRAEASGGVPTGPPKPKLEPGVRVRLKGIRQPAKVRRVLGDGLIEVEAGFMKMQVSVADVEEVLRDDGSGPALPKGVRFDQAQGPKWDISYREISVIGKHAEEATDEVDKFLDSAALANVDRVRIVHGHGMGILKRAISELLAHNPHVAKFYPAGPSEGGTGATIVELKG